LQQQPGMLYVVLYSGHQLQDAAPLLVVPPAVAQELHILFSHMLLQQQQQQQQQPVAGGAASAEVQQAHCQQVRAVKRLAPAEHTTCMSLLDRLHVV
jgi:hypothetical protein